ELKELATANGREWRRTVNRRAVVVIKETTPLVSLPLGTVLEAPESRFWTGLAFVEAFSRRPGSKPQVFLGVGDDIAATLRGLRQSGRTFPGQLQADRERVKTTLDVEREQIAKDPKKASVFIEVMREAVDKGYLDEAIFLSLFEFRLV